MKIMRLLMDLKTYQLDEQQNITNSNCRDSDRTPVWPYKWRTTKPNKRIKASRKITQNHKKKKSENTTEIILHEYIQGKSSQNGNKR